MLTNNEHDFARFRGLNPDLCRRVWAKRRKEQREAERAAARAESAERLERERGEVLQQARDDAECTLAAKRPVSLIIAETAVKHGVRVEDILGSKQTPTFIAARHEAVYRAHVERPDMSFIRLGRIFGRDHSTIIHAVKKMEKRGEIVA